MRVSGAQVEHVKLGPDEPAEVRFAERLPKRLPPRIVIEPRFVIRRLSHARLLRGHAKTMPLIIPNPSWNGRKRRRAAAFTRADPFVEGHRTFEQPEPVLERGVEKMSVELQVDPRIQQRQKLPQRRVPAELVGGADIGEGPLADMLGLQKLADEEVAVIQEGGELCTRGAQLLYDAGTVHDIRVRDVGKKLVDIVSAEGHVAFAQQGQFGVVVSEPLVQCPVHAMAVTSLRLMNDDGARLGSDTRRPVTAAVIHDDHPANQRMTREIADRLPDTQLIIIGSEYDGDFANRGIDRATLLGRALVGE